MKEVKYLEGQQALDNFKTMASAVLQTPPKKKKKQTAKAASKKTAKKSDSDA